MIDNQKGIFIRSVLTIVFILVILFFLLDFRQIKETQEAPSASYKKAKAPEAYTKKAIPAGYNEPFLSHRKTRVVASGSYIYWQPSQQNFFVGQKLNSDILTSSNITRSTKDFNFEYQSGFKAGLGFIFPQDNWSLYAEYIRLHSNPQTKLTTSDPNFMQSAWVPVIGPSNPDVSQMTNHWHFHFDLLDLNLLRGFYVGKSLVVSPFITGRGVRIHQSLKATTYYTADAGPSSNEANYKQKSLQVGPRLGSDLHWLLGNGFKFSGKLGAALLYNRSHTSNHIPYTVDGEIINDHFSTTQGSFCPNIDMGVGFGWENKNNFGISVCYDILTFFNQNNVGNNQVLNDLGVALDLYATPYGFQSQNNLTLHGLTVTAKIAF